MKIAKVIQEKPFLLLNVAKGIERSETKIFSIVFDRPKGIVGGQDQSWSTMSENVRGTIKILDLYITFRSYCISRQKKIPIGLAGPNPIEKFSLRYRNQSWSTMSETYDGHKKIWTCILKKIFYWFSRSEYTGKTKLRRNFTTTREHLYSVNTA
jgi:hypothetical protein